MITEYWSIACIPPGCSETGDSKEETVVDSDLLASSGQGSEHQDGEQEAAKEDLEDGEVTGEETSSSNWRNTILKVNEQPVTGADRDGRGKFVNPNRYRLHFESESREEIERRKRLAKSLPVKPLPKVRTMCMCSITIERGKQSREREVRREKVSAIYLL